MMNKLIWTPVVCLLVALGGCGSTSKKSSSPSGASNPATSSNPASSPSPASGSGVAVSETEYNLTPASTKVSAGSVQVTVKNAGTIPHALEIENAGPGGQDLKSSTIQPGSSTSITARLKPGKTYQWYCPIANHKALGMKGSITVTAKSSSASSGGSTQSSSGGSTSGGGGY